MNMTEIVEQWRPIEGYEGLYEVSNLGRVKSLGNDKKKREKILKPSDDGKGYLKVNLSKEGKQKMFSVHRLVAQAFIPNPEGLPIINHRDENPKNNRVENIEWCTYEYNSNYGTCKERIVQTMISKGLADPEMCDILNKDKKEYSRLYYQKKREQILEQQREYYRRRKKQEKIKQTT